MPDRKLWEIVQAWNTQTNQFEAVRYAKVLNNTDTYDEDSVMDQLPREFDSPVWDVGTKEVREETEQERTAQQIQLTQTAREDIDRRAEDILNRSIVAGFVDPVSGAKFLFDNHLFEYLRSVIEVGTFPVKVVAKNHTVVTLATAQEAQALLTVAHERLHEIYAVRAGILEKAQAATTPEEVRESTKAAIPEGSTTPGEVSNPDRGRA